MLEERYKRVSKQLESLLRETKTNNSTKTNSLNANVCDINVIDLERIISTLDVGVDVSSDIFFKTIRPIVKTALTTASVWNYILETPLRTIKSIRNVEDELKDNLSELYDLKSIVSQQVVFMIYVLLFLIKNKAELRVGDLSNVLSASVNLMGVITDLSNNCPLVKTVLDEFLSSETLETATDIEDYINENLNGTTYDAETSEFNSGYVDKVINIYGKLEGSGLSYNYDSYVDQMIDFINQNITFLNNFDNYISKAITLAEGLITDSADSIVDFIRGLGVDEYLVSITGLEKCLSIIKKYDVKNAKEYNSYYKKLSKIPKELDIVSIDGNIYTVNKSKLYTLIIKYYMYKLEEGQYNTLTTLIDNLDCVVESLDDKTIYDTKDTLRIRNFTFFATYYYGCNIIMKFFGEQIEDNDTNSQNFSDYIDLEESKYIEELAREYYTSLSKLDASVYDSLQVVFDTFGTLTTEEEQNLVTEAKNNIRGDYDKLEKGYEESIASSRDFIVSKYTSDPSLITDIAVRNEVLAKQSSNTDLTNVYNQLLKYYFQDNLANVMDKLTKREYRDIIDNITTNSRSETGELFFFNNQMIVDLFGDGGFLYDMDFEQQLNSFINNPTEDTAVEPSLRFMVNRYTDKIKKSKTTYNSNFTLDDKLRDIVNRHFSSWKNFDVDALLSEYMSIVRNMNEDASVFDPNGVKDSLSFLKDLFIESFELEESSTDYTITNEVYNVAKIEQFFNSVSQIVSDKIA